MPSHRSLLLLLAAVLFLTAVSSCDGWGDGREAELEPADEAGYRTYIVFLERPRVDMDADAHRAWHKSFLPSPNTSLGEPRLRQSWYTILHGFSARLTDEEVAWVSIKPGFIRAFPNVIEYQQTTRTPAFLRLPYLPRHSPLDSADWASTGYGGEGMIIGIIDGGIADSHPSMGDSGFESQPPQRWKGSCHDEIKCNRKLIGAKNFVSSRPPVDEANGHGTHVASIAAGNFVDGVNFNGLAEGTASGVAPLAHVAVYKVCGLNAHCYNEAQVSAIIAAVADGVDIISVSMGALDQRTYDHNPVAVAGYAAMRAGILVVASVGNYGPTASLLSNDVPWLLTVGAGTVDRSFTANLVVEDGHSTVIDGQSLSDRRSLSKDPNLHDLLYDAGYDSCEFSEDEMQVRVPGRVVVCQEGDDFYPDFSSKTVDSLFSNRASAIVCVKPHKQGYSIELLDTGDRPILQVPYNYGRYLKEYSSSPHPQVAYDFSTETVVGETIRAPTMAGFSSRGPSRYPILKPDLVAPGANILGAIPGFDGAAYSFMSGSSMAVPHVSGAAILLKRIYPSWSPARIRSALMTTADTIDNYDSAILDEQYNPASAYMLGAGHLNIPKATDPGLVYDTSEQEYISYICSTLGDTALRSISRVPSVRCSDFPNRHPSQLNYPSFTLPLLKEGFTVERALTNVVASVEEETYTVEVVMDQQVRLSVEPSRIIFRSPNEVHRFQVSVSPNTDQSEHKAGDVYFGSITWSSSKHTVRSPVVVVYDLVTRQPPAPMLH